jgi:CRISPR-associated protein Cas5h
MGKVLVFDVWGEYAHFRKYYTTTSPLTFSIPPRTSLSGLIGAILGYGKEDYISQLSKSNATIAVGLVHPVKKMRLAENLIDTKKAGRHMNKISQRTQIRFEFLKDPWFRIFFSHKDHEIQSRLKELLCEHKCVYTPCLGLSEHIADFRYIGEVEAVQEVPNGYEYIASAVPEKRVLDMVYEDDGEYISETMPVEMAPDRSVIEYASIIFERKARCIKARVDSCLHLETGERIVPL